jgi:hypothetical protein
MTHRTVRSSEPSLDELLQQVSARVAIEYGVTPLDEPLLLPDDDGRVEVVTASVSSSDELDTVLREFDEPIDVFVHHASGPVDVVRSRFEKGFIAVRPNGVYVLAGSIDRELTLDLIFSTVDPASPVMQVDVWPSWLAVHRDAVDDDHETLELVGWRHPRFIEE